MNVRAGVVLAVVAATDLLTAGHARGQEPRAERPYRGVFGGDDGVPRPGQSLALDWSVAGAYDDNATSEIVGFTDPRYYVQGRFGTGAAALSYGARGESSVFTATGVAGGRYYPELSELSSYEGAGHVGFSTALGRRVSVNAAGNMAYRPYYQFDFLTNLLPGVAPPPGIDGAALVTRSSYDYDGRVDMRADVGARSSLTGEYSYRRTQFADSPEAFRWQLANARFSHNVSRDAAIRVGYGYGQSQNSLGQTGPEQVYHNIELGVDYRRALSFSRRTSVTFATGSSLFNQDGGRYFHVLADAALVREIGRTWTARAAYHRGVQFIPGFSDPLFADTFQSSIGGLITRRLSALAGGGYSAGQLGTNPADDYGTWTGSADLQFALNRVLALSAEYSYYNYQFADTVDLLAGVPGRLDRHGFRLGLKGWLPLAPARSRR